jgi:hypothetical protein
MSSVTTVEVTSTIASTQDSTPFQPTTTKVRKQLQKRSLRERIQGKFYVEPGSGCHIWTGAKSGLDKYPIINSEGDAVSRYTFTAHGGSKSMVRSRKVHVRTDRIGTRFITTAPPETAA